MNRLDLSSRPTDEIGHVVTDRSGGPPDGTIRIAVPADPLFVAVVRLSVGAAAGMSDLVLDDIEDMRIAADEAVTLLLEVVPRHPQRELSAELSVSSGAFRAVITLHAERDRTVARDGLAWLALVGIDPDVSVTDDGREVSIAFGRTHRVA